VATKYISIQKPTNIKKKLKQKLINIIMLSLYNYIVVEHRAPCFEVRGGTFIELPIPKVTTETQLTLNL
jgi:hypothetical protein